MKSRVILALIVITLILPSFATSCRSQPLRVWFTEPKMNAVVGTTVDVKGSVNDSKATVWINDVQLPVTKKGANGTFSTTMSFAGLDEGDYVIKATASRGKPGKWKDTVSNSVKVTVKP